MSFEDFMASIFGMPDHQHPEAHSTNPAEFPRAVEIVDADALMAVDAIAANQLRQKEIMGQIRTLMEDLNLARAEQQITETRFWRAMRERFPHVLIADQCGMGYRKHDGKFWLVSWGGSEQHHHRPKGENDGTNET